MIYAKLNDLARYKGLSPHLDTAIDYLLAHKHAALCIGRNAVDGDNVYINCSAYTTAAESESFFEAHRQYADIHFMLEGEERIDIAETGTLTQFLSEPDKDLFGYAGKAQCMCTISPTHVLVVFPEDAHKVRLIVNAPAAVKKAVVKVKL